jgi:hypothetical protein
LSNLEIAENDLYVIATVLLQEPSGLSIGKVKLADGSTVLEMPGEPILSEDKKEITAFGGWRNSIMWPGNRPARELRLV